MAEQKLTTRIVQTPAGAVAYQLERKAVKNLNLRVRRDGSVYVSAHRRVPVSQIDAFVAQKGAFILEAVRRFAALEQQRPRPRQYADGETISILGRPLRLTVSRGNRDEVTEEGDRLLLRTKAPEDAAKRRRLVERYLDQRCRQVFGAALEECYPPFRRYGVPMPALRVREMKSRWGSCLVQKGVITLNKRLLAFPMERIRYVTFHELCHFIHPDHSRRFYDLLAAFVPDWKAQRAALNYGVDQDLIDDSSVSP